MNAPWASDGQAGHAGNEPEPDRGAREVEAACQVREAGIARHERDERRDQEHECRQRDSARPVATRVAQTLAERGEAAHSTASVAPEAPGEHDEPERERDHVAERRAAAPVRRGDRRLDEAERDPGQERLARIEPGDDGGDEPVEPVARSSVDVEGGGRSSEDRGQARPDPGQREGQADEERHRQADDHRGVEVLRNRLERAPEPGALQQPHAERGERERRRGDEDRAHLDRRAAEVPDAVVAEPPERDRVGEHVGGPVEEDDEQRPDRECHGERCTDPADHRAAGPVGLDREEVGADARGGRDDETDDERQQEPAAADARLRDRAGARRHEERHEDPERDQLPECEVHDAGEAEDERVPDRDQPVDGPRCETAGEDLESDRHERALYDQASPPTLATRPIPDQDRRERCNAQGER